MVNPDLTKPRIISVSQLNYYVKSLLDNDPHLSGVFVTGEISNLTDHYRSGHIYFSLKDKNSVVRAVMFAGNARNLKFKPEEGMKVIALCRVSLYEATGGYQIYVEDMQPDGIGALTIAFEQLKKKLEEKGIFSEENKKPIPKFPKTVGVITSPTGAAVQDIRNILTRRFPSVDIVLCPVLVQGAGAPAQLINAVNLFNEYDCADVIIIGRGGGSIEDLWAFNDENLAYAIYASNIPVISAVGHETDFTICDFVSDLRAPTPSAAAELAVPDINEIKQILDSLYERICFSYGSLVSAYNNRLAHIRQNSLLYKNEVFLERNKYNLEKCETAIINAYQKQTDDILLRFKETVARLDVLSPLSILHRGYGVVTKENAVITDAASLSVGDSVDLKFANGGAKCNVLEVIKE